MCLCVFCSPWQELEQQFERERLSLEEQKMLLRQQLEALREELTAKLTAANEEVTPPTLGHSENSPNKHCLDQYETLHIGPLLLLWAFK